RMADHVAELEKIIEESMATHDGGTVARACRKVLERVRAAAAQRTDPEPNHADDDYARLWRLGLHALALLGGQAEPSLTTVADYDHEKYGPMLGVSDEGSATKAIRQGAVAAPKCHALRDLEPLTVGVAHDAERLGGVGEVVVGPDENATIRLACRDRIL